MTSSTAETSSSPCPSRRKFASSRARANRRSAPCGRIRRADVACAKTMSRCVGSRPIRAAAMALCDGAADRIPQPCISGVMSLVSGLLARSVSAFSTSPLAMLNSASDEVGCGGGGAAAWAPAGTAEPCASWRMRPPAAVLVIGEQPVGDLLGVADVADLELIPEHVVERKVAVGVAARPASGAGRAGRGAGRAEPSGARGHRLPRFVRFGRSAACAAPSVAPGRVARRADSVRHVFSEERGALPGASA